MGTGWRLEAVAPSWGTGPVLSEVLVHSPHQPKCLSPPHPPPRHHARTAFHHEAIVALRALALSEVDGGPRAGASFGSVGASPGGARMHERSPNIIGKRTTAARARGTYTMSRPDSDAPPGCPEPRRKGLAGGGRCGGRARAAKIVILVDFSTFGGARRAMGGGRGSLLGILKGNVGGGDTLGKWELGRSPL